MAGPSSAGADKKQGHAGASLITEENSRFFLLLFLLSAHTTTTSSKRDMPNQNSAHSHAIHYMLIHIQQLHVS